MFVNEYLNRIGIGEKKNPSFSFLCELQSRHLLSIPFEDLDIPDRDTIILDLERIYKKIISRKRGGFCYELNGLFFWLLTELGFNAEMIEARVYNKDKNETGPPFDHMAILVHLNKTYLVDVGFGDSLRKPIEFPGGEEIDISGHYKIIGGYEPVNRLMRFEENEWRLKYEFTTVSRRLEDFSVMCAFQQRDSGSHFRNRMLCTIATEDGRITLNDNSLTVTRGEVKEKKDLKDPEEFYFLLNKYFGINLG